MVNPSAAIAARALLGWSRDQLAEASNVPVSSIYLLERLGSAGTQDDKRILAALNEQTLSGTKPLSSATSAVESAPKDDRQSSISLGGIA